MMRTDCFENELADMRESLLQRAMNLSKNYEEAEDLTHDALLKAIVFRKKYHANTNLKAWVFTIMKHQFINQHRRKLHYRSLMTKAAIEPNSILNPDATLMPSAETRLFFSDVERCIAKLNDKYRCPFTDYVHGYQYRELSEKYGLPIGTIKSRIHYARKHLLNTLE